jgi:flagellum-specific peptidoglycan hydrolase FlgJ
MTSAQQNFITTAMQAADAALHPFADYAACEAALESGYGTSGLARTAKNLFGMKQHVHPTFGTVSFSTKEFLHNEWVVVPGAAFVKYPTLKDCFVDRMATLVRLAGSYVHYAAALNAKDGTTFITEVSKTWSTDPSRAMKVLAIHKAWEEMAGHTQQTGAILESNEAINLPDANASKDSGVLPTKL